MCEENKFSMQQLKQQRMTSAEKFVLDTIKGVRPNEPDRHGNLRRHKNGNCLFIQDFEDSLLEVSYLNIWFVLEKEYGLNINEKNQLITKLLYKYTNNGQLKVV